MIDPLRARVRDLWLRGSDDGIDMSEPRLLRAFLMEQIEYHRHTAARDRVELDGGSREPAQCPACEQVCFATGHHDLMAALLGEVLKAMPKEKLP